MSDDTDPQSTDRSPRLAEAGRAANDIVSELPPFIPPNPDRETERRHSTATPPDGPTDPSLQSRPYPASTFMPAAGSVLAGRYKLLRFLGQGGMGQVWMAEIIGTQHPVALKWLSDSAADDEEMRARFRREIRASLAIRHPGVVHGLDLDRLDDGRDVLVMEYVDGLTLEALLSDRGHLTPAETIHIGRQVAAALAATHEAGFIHRDLKPSNMIVSVDVPILEATVRLLDLGVCRDESEHHALSLTAHYGGVLGTPSYMAPEQLAGTSASVRSDVFSLGVVLYRMLSGHRPFPGSTFAELADAVGTMNPDPLASIAPDSERPAELDELVHGMLEFDPQDRPSSAHTVAEVLADLERPRRALLRAAAVIGMSVAAAFIVGFAAGHI